MSSLGDVRSAVQNRTWTVIPSLLKNIRLHETEKEALLSYLWPFRDKLGDLTWSQGEEVYSSFERCVEGLSLHHPTPLKNPPVLKASLTLQEGLVPFFEVPSPWDFLYMQEGARLASLFRDWGSPFRGEPCFERMILCLEEGCFGSRANVRTQNAIEASRDLFKGGSPYLRNTLLGLLDGVDHPDILPFRLDIKDLTLEKLKDAFLASATPLF